MVSVIKVKKAIFLEVYKVRNKANLVFYKNGELVIDNDKEYSQISNLDEILLQMVRIFKTTCRHTII